MAVIGYYLFQSIAVIGYFRCELCTRSIHFLQSKVLRDIIQVITKSAIHCLARRGGVKRIFGHTYE
jgi:hypothetical protein